MAAIRQTLPTLLRGRQPLQRAVHIRATPSTTSITGIPDLSAQTQAIPKLSGEDVTFEVLGAPYSLLSVGLPSNATLCTRTGTLLGLNGTPTAATSTLALRPHLHNRISSPSPMTALIATNTPYSTFCVLSLDGTADWTLCQRSSLLAWCGHSLLFRGSEITGRGLVALSGRGSVYQIVLNPGEEFMAHPRSLLAYSAGGKKPSKLRLAATTLRLQVPRIPKAITTRLPPTPAFVRDVTASKAWAVLAKAGALVGKATWMVKTWVWGDRAFLKFVGPATVVIQSRTGSRMRDMISREEIDEAAAVQGGGRTVRMLMPPAEAVDAIAAPPARIEPVAVKKVGLETVGQAEKALAEKETKKMMHAGSLKRVIVRDGKVEFEDSDFKEFIRK